MGRVIHFEIVADDLARARKFYEQVAGWTFSDGMGDGQYWIAKTGDAGKPGIDGALMPRGYSPNQPVRNVIDVDTLEDAIEKVKAAGGRVAGDIQDIPGVGRWIRAFDTEGNEFGLLQSSNK